MHESFRYGFEKDAAWYHRMGNKIKGMFTGKEYLYHGTSATRAKGIAQEGLRAHAVNPNETIAGTMAQHDPGRKDLVFTSRDPDISKGYGKQFLAAKKIKEINPAMGNVGLPGDTASLIRFGIPKKEYRAMNPINNPVGALAAQGIEDARAGIVQGMQDNLPKWLPGKKFLGNKYTDLAKRSQISAHKDDVAFKDPVSSKYVEQITPITDRRF